jgi:ribulose-5-phosphate 4-epimerase/fuculose-1-phosphate aldolase
MQNTGEQQARCDLAAAHRLAVRDGLNEGVWNHLSVVSPDDPDVMLITPGYTHWGLVKASNLAAIGPDGMPVEAGGPEPTVAGFIIHYPAHAAIPEAKCLMHVHSPYITALSMRKDVRLDTCSSQQAAQFHDDVAYFEVYDGLLDSEDEGKRMADTMGDKRALMMRNHGAMVLATGDGHALNQIPDDMASGMADLARNHSRADKFFRGMCDLLDAQEPDYVN